ncbi:alpha/beta fold hydrolase [Amycolatopsis thermophila]|uniref:Pimeloyl-ACP methyl ester carboxylesterase n=1 Tax=Amycolatopsis thermophila TaxID=206084 RepID=A0ABU0EWB9_9PSEU|nr:alpha/beta fold hydrolase [Amycolatopsis thermophila]MDQ0379608.1 pimeloyl-ACP methyl ester carboxylesterase [Amycolatopsis thermophila]
MYVRTGGTDGPTLLVLHGLGATGAVWEGLVERWPGRWIAPDLPGHGRSDPLPRYSFGGLAAAVAAEVPSGTPVAVLGHSLGGVVALTLASGWFGVRVSGACGLGIKVRWTSEELARAAAQATRPAKTFESRAEAAARWLKVSGLDGLVPEDSPIVDSGLAGGRRLALDQAAFGVGAPDLDGLLAAARAPVVLAAGEHDPMCPAGHLPPDAVVLPGLGHNAHVEDPAALDPLLDRLQVGAHRP